MTRQRQRRGLTRDELKSATLVCFRNAEELQADAELLCSAKRYARAVFLSCIGLEELGKAALSLELYEADWQFDTTAKGRDFWEFWRHHQSKTAHGQGYLALNPEVLDQAGMDRLPKGHGTWSEYEERKRQFYSEYSGLTTSIKEGSLYVDFVDREPDGKASGFSLPSHVFGEKHARRFAEDLRARTEALRPRVNKLGWLNAPPYPPDEAECQ